MSRSKLRRRRGVLLSDCGLSRAHDGQRRLAADGDGPRISLETLSAGVGLSSRTLSRVMNRESPVDLRTLETLFFALRLVLSESDYEYGIVDSREGLRAHALPERLTSLLGREMLLERLEELTRVSRLLTLTGTGGIGKTRLAIELASRREAASGGRTWFIDLAIVKDPRESVSSVITAFGIPSDAPGSIAAIREHFVGQAAVLVLDNCEHVARALGPFVVELLIACPAMRVIATSREPFSVESERVFRVPPLEVPKGATKYTVEELMQYPAIALFVERAGSQNQSFVLNEAISPVICEIVQRLDGLPLAIELAAAQAGVMSPADLLGYLRERFTRLASQSVDRDPRHRSIKALMDWSFERLTEDERLVCRRASVFTGSFDAAALRRVCGDAIAPHAVDDVASRLVRKSLLEIDTAAERTRYFCLESVREYTWAQLEDAGDSAFGCWLHALHYLQLTANVIRSFSADDQAEALAALTREYGNVRGALEWSFTGTRNEHIGASLVSELPEYWDARGQYREGELWLRRAVAIDGDFLTLSTRAKLFEGLSLLLFRQKRLEEASQIAALSLNAFAAVADDFGLCRARNLLGVIALDAGDAEMAREHFSVNLERGESLVNARIRIVALNNLGRIEGEVDRNMAAALDHFEQSLELATTTRLHTMVAMALLNVAEAHADLGDPLLAVSFSKRGMQVALDLENHALYCIQALQTVIYRMRAAGRASARHEASIALDAIARDPYRTELFDQLDSIAGLLIREGEAARAVVLLTATAAQRSDNGARAGPAPLGRHARFVQSARQQLGAREYDVVRAAALALSLEAAFDAALLASEAPIEAECR